MDVHGGERAMNRPIIDAFKARPVHQIEIKQVRALTYEMFAEAFGMPLGLMVAPGNFVQCYETYTGFTKVLPGAPWTCRPSVVLVQWCPYRDDGDCGESLALDDVFLRLPDDYDGTPEMWFRLALLRAKCCLDRLVDPVKFETYRSIRIEAIRGSAFKTACARIAKWTEKDYRKRVAMTAGDVEMKLLLTVQRHLTWFDTWKKDGMPICFDGIHTKRVGDK